MNAQSAPRTRRTSEPTRPGAPDGQRQRRKLATLSALRQAALDLVLEHGVDHVTANDIATAAGVSRRTFFNYFATKEDALVGENPQLATVIHDAITARPAHEPPLSAVHAAFVDTAATVITPDMRDRIQARHRLLEAHPELLGRHLARYTTFERLLTQVIRDRTAAHDNDAETDPGLLAAVISSTVRLCVQRWAEHGDTPLAEHLETAFRTLRSGLR